MNTESQYLVLDSRNEPLARAVLEGRPDGPTLQFDILNDGADAVMSHEQLQFLPLADDQDALLGRVIRCRGERLTVERLQQLDSELRQNLRMPVSFVAPIYPITGKWWGRAWIESNDLSCGGIAFFTNYSFEAGERFEMVIPITTQPVILRCKILRERPCAREGMVMYAAEFLDMCHDEEMLVREAVFNVQLSTRPRKSAV